MSIQRRLCHTPPSVSTVGQSHSLNSTGESSRRLISDLKVKSADVARPAYLKSDRCSCSFFRAWLRVTYCTALPAFPCTREHMAELGKPAVSQQGSVVSHWRDHVAPTCFSFLPMASRRRCCGLSGQAATSPLLGAPRPGRFDNQLEN